MKNYKVVIVGAGPVGMVLASYLGENDLDCLLIERGRLSQHLNPDGKLFAVIEGSRMILEELGIRFSDAQPIRGIRVVPLDRKPVTLSSNEGNVGLMIESHILKSALIDKIKGLKSVTVMEETTIESASQTSDFVMLNLAGGGEVQCQVCAACDGPRSSMKEFFHKGAFTHEYKNSAMVVNLEHKSDHGGFACEWFMRDYIMATLPMKGSHASSLVLMDSKDQVSALYQMKERDFLKEMNSRMPSLAITALKSKRYMYEKLICSVLRRPVQGRVVFAGDSAHALHPLTGQAMNLGFRDAYALGKLLAKNNSLGLPLSSSLGSYGRRRLLDTALISSFVHGIAWSFERRKASLIAAFMMGKSRMFPFAERRILEYAAGKGHFIKIGMG